ncbi:TPA: hypothetical protein IRE62_004465 [Escherichia coli]|nr:hypothetical protein [Escherichia coli]
MDINAGTIATGEETIEEVGWKLFHFILDVASGKKKTLSDQSVSYTQVPESGDLLFQPNCFQLLRVATLSIR